MRVVSVDALRYEFTQAAKNVWTLLRVESSDNGDQWGGTILYVAEAASNAEPPVQGWLQYTQKVKRPPKCHRQVEPAPFSLFSICDADWAIGRAVTHSRPVFLQPLIRSPGWVLCGRMVRWWLLRPPWGSRWNDCTPCRWPSVARRRGSCWPCSTGTPRSEAHPFITSVTYDCMPTVYRTYQSGNFWARN